MRRFYEQQAMYTAYPHPIAVKQQRPTTLPLPILTCCTTQNLGLERQHTVATRNKLTATTICVAGFIWLGTRNIHGIFSFRLLQAKPLGVLLLAKIAWRVSLDEAGWINQPVQLTTLKDLQPKKLMVWNPQITFWTRILGFSIIQCYPITIPNHWPPGPKPQLQRQPLEVVRLHINKASSWQNYHISKMILVEFENFAQAHLLLDFFEIPN